ncbi:MAG: Uma2 family endonuclease [Cyanobacteria bacterium SBLK]|nr:Uma2 family endonuclease [Cyanobacteria bacterium SBLK]
MVHSPSPIADELRPFPDHTQLPESDGTFVKNFQEHPQSILLTDSIEPILQELHPDGQYAIGQDSGIYWRETDPPEKGAEAPDWFYVPEVPPRLDGRIRRSYVLWREYAVPLIALEFASGTGTEERDRTPLQVVDGTVQKPGKFWVYEHIIRIPYYGIFIINTGELEVYHWEDGTYQRMRANDRGHYPINRMNVELGVWRGTYLGQSEQSWLRWWDREGNLLLTGKERATIAESQADEERQKRQQLIDRLQGLTPEQLEALGIDRGLLE